MGGWVQMGVWWWWWCGAGAGDGGIGRTLCTLEVAQHCAKRDYHSKVVPPATEKPQRAAISCNADRQQYI